MPDTLYGHDIFAVLTARDHKNKASSAFKLPQNSKWFRRASGGVAEEPTIDSREPTPAEEPQSKDEESGAIGRLVVPFYVPLKNPLNGVQFGTKLSSCDISSWGTEGRQELAGSSTT